MAEKDSGKRGSNTIITGIASYQLIHRKISDAGQFSYAAVCALCLRKLFDDDWNRAFAKATLSKILKGLEQPKQVQEAVTALYEGQGQDFMDPFVDQLRMEETLKADASPVVLQLISFGLAEGNYDARMRVLIKTMAWQLKVDQETLEEMECELAQTIIAHKYKMSEEEKHEQEKKAKHRKYKRAALIGLATVTGGTLIGLTGGLAAPLVAAGAGAIIGGAGAAALGSVAGVAIIGSLFGVAGAGLTGYKMKRRMGAIEEFEFEPLISEGPLKLKRVRQQLHITIAITGWIDSKMQDFKQPWQSLAESQEQYTLRWESRYLKDLGQALDYIFNSAVTVATNEALKYTVLSSIMAAIAWPAALLSVSQVIDNPWSVALQRAVSAGRQLAEVLLSREQGKRPVTLVGYSLGGRVIFYCLEEMAKRKGCEGIVESVVILGAPVTGDPKAWAAFGRVVSGRIVNGYCRGDWLLKFLYRTASVQLNIAGLRPIKWDNHRMHNIDLSDVVSGHLDYMKKLDTILPLVDIRVREVMVVEEEEEKPLKTSLSMGFSSTTPIQPLPSGHTPTSHTPTEPPPSSNRGIPPSSTAHPTAEQLRSPPAVEGSEDKSAEFSTKPKGEGAGSNDKAAELPTGSKEEGASSNDKAAELPTGSKEEGASSNDKEAALPTKAAKEKSAVIRTKSKDKGAELCLEFSEEKASPPSLLDLNVLSRKEGKGSQEEISGRLLVDDENNVVSEAETVEEAWRQAGAKRRQEEEKRESTTARKGAESESQGGESVADIRVSLSENLAQTTLGASDWEENSYTSSDPCSSRSSPDLPSNNAL